MSSPRIITKEQYNPVNLIEASALLAKSFTLAMQLYHLIAVFMLCVSRLWGDHGQESLENAHVCIINATATGTEILKNLVLPGTQMFVVGSGWVKCL